MPDGYLPDWLASLDRALAMDWDRLVPGHPGPGGRLGTKDDVRMLKDYLTDVSNAMKQLAAERKRLNDDAMRAVKLLELRAGAATRCSCPATSSASAVLGPRHRRRPPCGARRHNRRRAGTIRRRAPSITPRIAAANCSAFSSVIDQRPVVREFA